jgi:glycosyltransferase involved in cell wall biosynthesis
VEVVDVRCAGLGELGTRDDEARFAASARAALAAAGAELVHDHTACGDSTPALVPTVTTMHGPPGGVLSGPYRRADHAGDVVAISHCQARAAIAAGIRVSRVIHHGVDTTAFPVGDGRGGYLLHLGRMSPDKGIDIAIRVARRAGVPIVVASKVREPEEIAYFETTIRPLLGPGVDFVGEIGGATKLEMLGSAVALLNPIRWDEPFGMVTIEALACGTPVIGTPRGATPEIIDDRVGRLAADEDGLVDAVASVHRVDRSSCRRRVEERFSTERMVRDHLSLYGSLLDARLEFDRPAMWLASAG